MDACSGIRSLISLITLAIIYGYLMETRRWVRVTLACAAVPIAIAANIFRIVVTGLVGRWNPDLAQGFYHEFQGWLVFVASLIMLYTVHGLVNSIWKPFSRSDPRQQSPAPGGAVAAMEIPPRSSSVLVLIAAVLMLATAIVFQLHTQDEILPPHKQLSSIPAQFAGWASVDETLDQETLGILGHPEYVLRNYQNSNAFPINLFLSYYPTQKVGETPHTPLHCLVGAGFTPIRKEVVQLSGPDGTFNVNRWVALKGEERQLVIYWFQVHGREVTNEYSAKYYLIANSIRLHRSDGALVRFMTPMERDESPEAAQERIMQLGSHLLPILDNYIPR